MKVLLLHNRYKIRGGEDVVFDREQKLLRDLGLQVDQLLVTNDAIDSPLAAAATAFHCAYSPTSRALVAEKIRAFRPDIVHAHNTFPLLTRSVWDACREAGVPIVQTLHNYRLFCANALLLRQGKPCTLCLDQKPWRSVAYGCYRDSRIASIPVARMIDQQLKERAWENVNLFVSVTEFAKSLFLQLGIPEEKLVVKSNFSPDLRQELGETAQPTGQGAVFLGRFSEEKGLGTLADSWRRQAYPLKIFGDGPLAAQLREAGLAPETGRSQRECWQAMARARCLVAPIECFEGGFPLVIQEALSLGLPVVSTQIGGIPDYLRHEENALLVPPKDPAALAQAVHRLLADDELWIKLSAAGRRLFEEKFTAEKNGRDLLAVYERAKRSR